jgi:hypothetical protein
MAKKKAAKPTKKADKKPKKAAAKKPAKKAVAKAAKKPAQKAPAKAAKPAKAGKAPSAGKTAISKVAKFVDSLVGSGKKGKAAAKPAAKAAKAPAPEKVSKKSKVDAIPAPSALVSAQVEDLAPEMEEIVLTDAEGRRYCRVNDCDQLSSVDGYCRYHYLFFWKKIQNRKKILADGKLERYIEELTARYTDKFIELLRKDLKSEKDFMAAIQELELDDDSSNSEEQDEEETKSYLEEIRGMTSEDSGSATDDDF